MQVDRQDVRDTADASRAAGEDAAVTRAIANRHDPFWTGRSFIRALERLAHVARNRSGHEQHVGVPWGGDEAQAEALEVVKHVVERVDLELATVARSGIDLADGEAA